MDDQQEYIDRMLGATAEAVQIFDDRGSIRVRPADAGLFNVLYPLAAHAIEQVRAARLLFDQGLAFAAEANARVAFQHALSAQWVIHTADGERWMADEMQRNFSKEVETFGTLTGADTSVLGDIEKPDLLPAGAPAKYFEQMCIRFSPGNARALYSMYRRLSGSVHPSYATIRRYMVRGLRPDGSEGLVGIRDRCDPEPNLDLFAALAMSAVWAVNAIESVREGQPRLSEIQDLADRHQVPSNVSADDAKPDLRRPRGE